MAAREKATTEPDDAVVQEVREIRARMCEEAGGTIEGLMQLVHDEARAADRTRQPRRRKRA